MIAMSRFLYTDFVSYVLAKITYLFQQHFVASLGFSTYAINQDSFTSSS